MGPSRTARSWPLGSTNKILHKPVSSTKDVGSLQIQLVVVNDMLHQKRIMSWEDLLGRPGCYGEAGHDRRAREHGADVSHHQGGLTLPNLRPR